LNGENHTHPVASLKPNDLGLFDMHGNVREWCYDYYGSYPTPTEEAEEAVKDAPPVASVEDTVRRVLRGGSFYDQPSLVRSAYRNFDLPAFRTTTTGFRPARTYHLFP
jgi:formylglycine-generating enzyme required for sulfatase activity